MRPDSPAFAPSWAQTARRAPPRARRAAQPLRVRPSTNTPGKAGRLRIMLGFIPNPRSLYESSNSRAQRPKRSGDRRRSDPRGPEKGVHRRRGDGQALHPLGQRRPDRFHPGRRRGIHQHIHRRDAPRRLRLHRLTGPAPRNCPSRATGGRLKRGSRRSRGTGVKAASKCQDGGQTARNDESRPTPHWGVGLLFALDKKPGLSCPRACRPKGCQLSPVAGVKV